MQIPPRARKIYPGPNTTQKLEDYYPQNTVEVNGESFHKSELVSIYNFLDERPDQFFQVEAFVVHEPENQYDPNAVAVYIQEKRVGYVPKELAPIFVDFFKEEGASSFWVVAGMKFVSELGQFRVRIMAETPLKWDLPSLPRMINTSLPVEKFYSSAPLEEDHWLAVNWRVEELAQNERIFFAGPMPGILSQGQDDIEFIDKKKNPTSIRNYQSAYLIVKGIHVKEFSSLDYPEVIESLQSLGGKAMVWVKLFWVENDIRGAQFFLLPGESQIEERPRMADFDPIQSDQLPF